VAIEQAKELISKREWLRQRLTELEHRYGMSTPEFLARWSSGELPEPEDPDMLSDFLRWEALAGELREVEEELGRMLAGTMRAGNEGRG